MSKNISLYKDDNYHTLKELKYKFKLSPNELNNYKEYKFNLESCEKLNLIDFNKSSLFYMKHISLVSNVETYCKNLIDGHKKYNKIINLEMEKVLYGFLFSEIEGSICIEGINSTRRNIKEISDGKIPSNDNEKIIKNMFDAWEFINTKPEFNKDNLYKLYCLLSSDVLKEDDKLKDGEYYRYDYVGIGNGMGGHKYDGCPHDKIEGAMDSLFKYVNNVLSKCNNYELFLLPHIVHYYILYIHPYFDYNGRCARVVSLWIMLLNKDGSSTPIFLGEAINNKRTEYYKSLEETRNNNNDLTYFLNYIMETSIQYNLMYDNIQYIKELLRETGETLSGSDEFHILRIMTYSKGNYFGWKDFLEYISSDMTQQGALKALNRLMKNNILEFIINNSKVKMFRINKDFIEFDIN